jgi:hypothetical protein
MTGRQEAETLTRVTVERVRTVEVVRIVIDDGEGQMRLPGLDEPVELNVLDGDEARELLEQANERALPKAGEGGR